MSRLRKMTLMKRKADLQKVNTELEFLENIAYAENGAIAFSTAWGLLEEHRAQLIEAITRLEGGGA